MVKKENKEVVKKKTPIKKEKIDKEIKPEEKEDENKKRRLIIKMNPLSRTN